MNFAASVIARSATVHELNGGVDLNGYSAQWGFPGLDAGWTPLSAGSVTTTAKSYIYGIAFHPGSNVDIPLFNFTAWGTKRDEVGSSTNPTQTVASGSTVQGAAGAINVTEGSGSSLATIIMMVALSAPAAAAGPSLMGRGIWVS